MLPEIRINQITITDSLRLTGTDGLEYSATGTYAIELVSYDAATTIAGHIMAQMGVTGILAECRRFASLGEATVTLLELKAIPVQS